MHGYFESDFQTELLYMTFKRGWFNIWKTCGYSLIFLKILVIHKLIKFELNLFYSVWIEI